MAENSLIPITSALISVSDKTGLVDFVRALVGYGVSIMSTGGTAEALKAEGLPVTDVSHITKFPEILDGRVKTLHPKIHGGILAKRRDAVHQEQMDKHGIAPIDLVVVNLYPFAEVYKGGQPWQACIEKIDVGGPAMIRAAAKNYHDVVVATSPDHYTDLLQAMESQKDCTDLALRCRLAQEAFAHTGSYDAMIASAFTKHRGEAFPKTHLEVGRLQEVLRYGENMHQRAALYVTDTPIFCPAQAKQLQGKELSYNNLNDADAAFALVSEFSEPTAAIIKHANPCGVASHPTLLSEAFKEAYHADPISAFGGIVAFNTELDEATAQALSPHFLEAVIAPSISHKAEVILSAKRSLRVLITGGLLPKTQDGWFHQTLSGGFLLQDRDLAQYNPETFRVVTQRSPSQREMRDLLFAMRVVRHVKSNAIVYAKNGITVGIGAGQMSRVDAARLAAQKAQDIAAHLGKENAETEGSVVASDAFFPFADGLIAAMKAGATAIVQPGGSKRDEEVIAAADAHGAAMVLTGIRAFRH
jgi:phosphoribosylaminoimidazolecarboxamide formyltransferase/IMP cyclohydrolase